MIASSRLNVAAQVERVAQLDDGVGDQLPGPVEGDVAPAIHAHELGADLSQALGRGQQVRLVPPAPDGVDREMLDEEQPIPDAPAATLFGQLVLELPGGLVGDGAEPLDDEDAAVGEEEGPRVAGRGEGHLAAGPAQRRAEVVATWRATDVAHLDHAVRPWRCRGRRASRGALRSCSGAG